MTLDLVWVHFGKRLPKYLANNLVRASQLFPTMPLNLITDSENVSHLPKEIAIHKPKRNTEFYNIEMSLGHPRDFRSNFWFHAIVRFIALDHFIKESRRPLIHFESDILIAKDFPFEVFEKSIDRIAFPIVSKERAIASTVFIPNSQISTILADFAVAEVTNNPKTSDMLILREFYDTFPQLCHELPVAPADKDNFKEEASDFFIERNLNVLDKFGGIIDGNDFGVYFFGTDPRNARGKMYLGREVDLNLIHTSKLKLRFNPIREFVDTIDSSGRATKLYSLHLTSKNPSAFTVRQGISYLKKACDKAVFPSKKFVWRVVFRQSFEAAVRRLKRTFRV